MSNCLKKNISVLAILSFSVLFLTGCSTQTMNWEAHKLAKRVVELEQVQNRMKDRSNLSGKRMSEQEYEQYFSESIDYVRKTLKKYSETPKQQQEFYNLVEKNMTEIKNKQNPEENGNTLFFNDLIRQFVLDPESTDNKADPQETNNSFRYGKSPADQVININSIMYDAHPASVGIDWNAKDKVPYPYDSLFASLGIYYDIEYECWRLSEQARIEYERKKQVVGELFNNSKTISPSINSENDNANSYDEKKPTTEKPKQETKPKQEKPAEDPKPIVNNRALFKGNNNPQAGGSDGITGQPGNQGKPKGLKDIKQYDSNGGRGNGTGYVLGGRGAKALQHPNNDFSEEGIIVVDIWVNRAGQVIRAEVSQKSTTIINSEMRQKAKQTALRTTFQSDPNAPEEQHGTITYTFVLQN